MVHPSIAKVTCNLKIMKLLLILTTWAHSNTIGNGPMYKEMAGIVTLADARVNHYNEHQRNGDDPFCNRLVSLVFL